MLSSGVLRCSVIVAAGLLGGCDAKVEIDSTAPGAGGARESKSATSTRVEVAQGPRGEVRDRRQGIRHVETTSSEVARQGEASPVAAAEELTLPALPTERVEAIVRTGPRGAPVEGSPRGGLSPGGVPTEAEVRLPPDPEFPEEYWPAKRPTREQLAADLAALRDDDVRFNATRAAGRLIQLLDHPLDREQLRPLAEALIDSDDLQQRWMVTELMFRLEKNAFMDGEQRAAHPHLHRRAIQWLESPPSLEAFSFRLDPSTRSTLDFCIAQLPYLEPELVDLLRSGTPRQRYSAALVLGCGRRTANVDWIARALLPHLADNREDGDALESAFALKRLGRAVLPQLPEVAVDGQQAFFLDALRREIHAPGSTRNDPKRSDITHVAPYGPVAAWRPWRFGWRLFED